MELTAKRLKEIISSGHDATMVTILESSGSTPRSAGARMLITSSGLLEGTIGGGSVEHRCIEEALEVLKSKDSHTADFILRQNEIEDLGMICGGDIKVSFEYIPAYDESTLNIPDNAFSRFSEETVYIFGGGHVSQALVPILNSVDFKCIILEDREEFTNPTLFKGVYKTILIDKKHISDYIKIKSCDYICIMTRGHKDDLEMQAYSMTTDAKYIGVIGSRRKIASVSAKLKERGFTDEAISHISTPIGLEIQAETPAEIAISIAAQLIKVRASH